MIELAIIMPLYNEEGSIEGVVKKWVGEFKRLDISFELHAYNDGSKDNSLSLLKTLAASIPELIIHDKPNSGHGPTILEGYQQNSTVPWLFQIDSDDELDIVGFESLWKNRNDFDFLIGFRRNRNSPIARTLVTWFTSLTISLFYGRGIIDINSPFRLMRTSSFNNLYTQIPADTFAPNVLISGYAILNKMRIKQVHIQHQFRQSGEVSIKKWKLFRAALLSFYQTIQFRFQVKR